MGGHVRGYHESLTQLTRGYMARHDRLLGQRDRWPTLLRGEAAPDPGLNRSVSQAGSLNLGRQALIRASCLQNHKAEVF